VSGTSYKILEDGSYYGWIEGLPDVWAGAKSLEECRGELELVVEDWPPLGRNLSTTNLNLNYPTIPRIKGQHLGLS